jgi:spore coat protein CotF
MEEKYMVNDILENIKTSLKTYQDVITETGNTNLRQTLQQTRNGDESFQYELYKVASAKGYYKPAANATPDEISKVRNEVEQ